MREAGFVVRVNIVNDLVTFRAGRGMPETLASCHSAVIADYVLEGHIPFADVQRLVEERPDAVGLSVPGMPLGSPGMEDAQGSREPYNTLLVLRSGATQIFARHNQDL